MVLTPDAISSPDKGSSTETDCRNDVSPHSLAQHAYNVVRTYGTAEQVEACGEKSRFNVPFPVLRGSSLSPGNGELFCLRSGRNFG